MARPSFTPTIEQRRMVEALAGYGVTEEHIASLFTPKKIDPKTLRKHFPEELKRGIATGTAKLYQTAFELAVKSKDRSMLKFLLNMSSRHREEPNQRIGGFREAPDNRTRKELIDAVADQLDRIAATTPAPATTQQPDDGPASDAGVSMAGL